LEGEEQWQRGIEKYPRRRVTLMSSLNISWEIELVRGDVSSPYPLLQLVYVQMFKDSPPRCYLLYEER
jgi:hypothetical protein